MSGIYIHIPFCRQACSYCDFHFTVRHDDKESLLKAIRTELHERTGYLNSDPQVRTIYFGGGTPSLLNHAELESILLSIRENYEVINDPEITLEANPDDLTAQKLGELRSVGINRLSIGIQSFHDSELKFMNRAHDVDDAVRCVNEASRAGFNNISIDLIYGVPGQGASAWEHNLNVASDLPVKHLSCYALTIEKHTLLHNLVKKEEIRPAIDEHVAEQFLTMNKFLTSKGFEHYEVSNLALPGYRSKHNTSYWNDVIYLGVGPSANSFDSNSRRSNVRSNKAYIEGILNGNDPSSTEILSEKNRFNEYIMTRLRTSEGINIRKAKTLLPSEYASQIDQQLKRQVESGMLIVSGDMYSMPYDKWLVSDAVIRELFI